MTTNAPKTNPLDVIADAIQTLRLENAVGQPRPWDMAIRIQASLHNAGFRIVRRPAKRS